jgi:hypothetical protein
MNQERKMCKIGGNEGKKQQQQEKRSELFPF